MKKIKEFLDHSLFRTRFYAKKTFGEVEKIRTFVRKRITKPELARREITHG
jgi:hypothetical protein